MVEELAREASRDRGRAKVRALIIVDREMRTKEGGRTFILHEQPYKEDGKTLRSITVKKKKKDALEFEKAFEDAEVKRVEYEHWIAQNGPVNYF